LLKISLLIMIPMTTMPLTHKILSMKNITVY
jgi:hypothetical protein